VEKSAYKYILHILAISVIIIFIGRSFPKYEQLAYPVNVKNSTLSNPISRLKLYEITSELGAGTRGSSLGVKALKIASLGYNSDYFSLIPTTKIKTENDKLFEKVKHPYAKRIPYIYKMWERMSSSIYQTMAIEKKFPIILTGDHSNAGGLISGVKMAHPDKKIGLIWVDAHADIHSPITTPSGNMHGMPIAALLNEDNLEKQTGPEFLVIGHRNPSISSESTWDEYFEDVSSSRPSWAWSERSPSLSTATSETGTLAGASTPLAASLARRYEWHRLLLTAADGSVLLQHNFESEWIKTVCESYQTLFRSRESAMRAGLGLGARHYDVHCWYPMTSDRQEPRIALVYGRRGTAIQGEGFGVGKREDGVVFLVVFRFPLLTAEGVTALRTFLRRFHPNMLQMNDTDAASDSVA
jgi:hypothetical protein